MTLDIDRAAKLIAAALILTVITQIAYMALGASGQQDIAYPIWRTEALAALVVSALGFVLVPRHALIGGCIAAGGIFNLIQVGMGLTMFYQLGYGGEGEPNPVFYAVLSMSFYLYFAAKAAFAIAGMALGAALWRKGGGLPKAVGLLAALTGIAAFALNAWAMMMGMDFVFPAGAAGTAATLFAAIALPLVIRQSESAA